MQARTRATEVSDVAGGPAYAAPNRRPLGSFERAAAASGERYPFNLVVRLELKGPDIRRALRGALDEIQRRHPLLRARLVGSGSEAAFEVVEANPVPVAIAKRNASECWRDIVEDELVRGFDESPCPLMRCTYIPPADGRQSADFVLTIHHAIGDGDSVSRLLQETLELATGVDGTRIPSAVTSLPPCADDGFPPKLGGGLRRFPKDIGFFSRMLSSEIAVRSRGVGLRPRPAPSRSRNRIVSTALSREESRSIARAARHHRVTMTGLVEAAALLAVTRLRYAGTRLPHHFFVFPQLRASLRPSVPAAQLGAYFVAMRLTETASGGDDIWDLATRCTRTILESVGRQERFLSSIWSPPLMRIATSQKRWRMATTAVSYTGHIELGTPDVSVRRVHAFVTNPPIGPEYTAQVRLFRGRLWWDAVTLDVDMDEDEARSITEETRSILIEAPGS
ncbi:MAG: condensation domain-containing protein [Thermoanaerobaculia bacterium]